MEASLKILEFCLSASMGLPAVVCRTRQTEDRLLTWVGMRLTANSEINC